MPVGDNKDADIEQFKKQLTRLQASFKSINSSTNTDDREKFQNDLSALATSDIVNKNQEQRSNLLAFLDKIVTENNSANFFNEQIKKFREYQLSLMQISKTARASQSSSPAGGATLIGHKKGANNQALQLLPQKLQDIQEKLSKLWNPANIEGNKSYAEKVNSNDDGSFQYDLYKDGEEQNLLMTTKVNADGSGTISFSDEFISDETAGKKLAQQCINEFGWDYIELPDDMNPAALKAAIQESLRLNPDAILKVGDKSWQEHYKDKENGNDIVNEINAGALQGNLANKATNAITSAIKSANEMSQPSPDAATINRLFETTIKSSFSNVCNSLKINESNFKVDERWVKDVVGKANEALGDKEPKVSVADFKTILSDLQGQVPESTVTSSTAPTPSNSGGK